MAGIPDPSDNGIGPMGEVRMQLDAATRRKREAEAAAEKERKKREEEAGRRGRESTILAGELDAPTVARRSLLGGGHPRLGA